MCVYVHVSMCVRACVCAAACVHAGKGDGHTELGTVSLHLSTSAMRMATCSSCACRVPEGGCAGLGQL